MAIVSELKSWTLTNENGREDNNKEYDKNHQEASLSSAPHPPHGGFLLVFSEIVVIISSLSCDLATISLKGLKDLCCGLLLILEARPLSLAAGQKRKGSCPVKMRLKWFSKKKSKV